MEEINSIIYPKSDIAFVSVQQPKQFDFLPQDNMTPVESAYCAHLFVWAIKSWQSLDSYPQWELIKRHFVEVDNG